MAYLGNTALQGQFTGGSIVDGTIDTIDLKDSAVTAAKLSSTAVTDKLGYTPFNKAGDTLTGALTTAASISLASAATVNLASSNSNNITITGTTTITSFGTNTAGVTRLVTFASTVTLTNGTNLVMPGGVSFRTAANDMLEFTGNGGTKWTCTRVFRAASCIPTALTPQTTAVPSGYYTQLAKTSSKFQYVNFQDYGFVQLPAISNYVTAGEAFVITNQGMFPFDITNSSGYRLRIVYPGETVAVNAAYIGAGDIAGWTFGNTQSYLAMSDWVNSPTTLSGMAVPTPTGVRTLHIAKISSDWVICVFINAANSDVYYSSGSVASIGINWNTPVLLSATTATTCRVVPFEGYSSGVFIFSNTTPNTFAIGFTFDVVTGGLTPTAASAGWSVTFVDAVAIDSTRVLITGPATCRVITYNANATPTTAPVYGATLSVAAGTKATLRYIDIDKFVLLNPTIPSARILTTSGATVTAGTLFTITASEAHTKAVNYIGDASVAYAFESIAIIDSAGYRDWETTR